MFHLGFATQLRFINMETTPMLSGSRWTSRTQKTDHRMRQIIDKKREQNGNRPQVPNQDMDGSSGASSDPTLKSRVVYHEAEQHENIDIASPNLWSTPWLHPITISVFVAVSICLVISIVLLWHFSALDHGLSVQVSRNHYLWTYGPTAGKTSHFPLSTICRL